MPFIINALEIIAKDMRKDNPETELVVAHFREAMEFEAHHIDAPGNMTEAAAKTYCEVKKNSTVLCKLNELTYMQQMSAQNHV